jgi:hypothetical protein
LQKETNAMTKRTITRLWIAGLVILFVGFVVGGVGLGLMFEVAPDW